jgi:uncharacterized protein (TIGR00303 family)
MDIAGSRDAIERFSCKNPAFLCVISHTDVSEIPGITVAGANPGMVKYTSPADAEFLHYGHCKCIPVVPATPDGKPTPALITRAALQGAKIPLVVVEAGTKIKPAIPAISFGLSHGANIAALDAMPVQDVEKALAYGRALGRQMARASDLVVVGESIPGGTTTALAVLGALGIDARFKVSSSMPENPHTLKNRVVASAYERAKFVRGSTMPAVDAIAHFGDPMMPSVAGIAAGAIEEGGGVMLAGGTQMAAVIAVLAALDVPLERICIGTTIYVAGDKSSDLSGLVRSISQGVPVLACDLHLGESAKPGLRAFAEGFVKEGVGAGGSSIVAMIKSKMDGKEMKRLIEREYELSIERRPT